MNFGTVVLERRIIFVVGSLLIFGQIMLFSASGVLGVEKFGSEFYYFSRQFYAALLGCLLMLGLSRIPYQKWSKVAFPLLFCQLAITAACYLPPLSHPVAGVKRWIQAGPITIQPSELAKIVLAIYVAHLIAFKNSIQFPWQRKVMYAIPVVILLALIFKQPDLGSTILLSCMIFGMFFIAGAKPVYVLGFVAMGALGFALSLIRSDYRQRRLMAFLNPWEDPQGTGFQTIQSFLSFYSGKIFGVGIGNGNSKLFYLPEVHTDFIFALVGEELGFIGSVVVLIIFAYFGFLLFKAVRFAPDAFGRYLAFGLSFSLMMQVMVNLGGVVGMIPVKGLPLPFISWGRSALLVNLCMVGILLNIAHQAGQAALSNNAKKSPPQSNPGLKHGRPLIHGRYYA